MRLVWMIGGGLGGLVIGAMVGIGAALVVMSFAAPRTDGTFGMREMLVCLPAGALIGLVAGLVWGYGPGK